MVDIIKAIAELSGFIIPLVIIYIWIREYHKL